MGVLKSTQKAVLGIRHRIIGLTSDFLSVFILWNEGFSGSTPEGDFFIPQRQVNVLF